MTTSSIAAGAYQTAAKLFSPSGQAANAGGAGGFSGMLNAAIQNLEQTSRTTDQRTQAMAAGKADLIDVVTAVAETEVAIESLVAVRDRVIQSYEEIMRMQI